MKALSASWIPLGLGAGGEAAKAGGPPHFRRCAPRAAGTARGPAPTVRDPAAAGSACGRFQTGSASRFGGVKEEASGCGGFKVRHDDRIPAVQDRDILRPLVFRTAASFEAT